VSFGPLDDEKRNAAQARRDGVTSWAEAGAVRSIRGRVKIM
jgi:hypothetical protein